MSDNPLKDLVPHLPAPILWGLAAASIFSAAWPTIRDMFLTALPWHRKYEREKMELELLKMRYEIEVLRKEHQLEAIVELPKSREIENLPRADIGASSLRWPWRFMLGFAGSILPLLVQFAIDLARGLNYVDGSVVLVTAMLGSIGGYVVAIEGVKTARNCFLFALAASLSMLALSKLT